MKARKASHCHRTKDHDLILTDKQTTLWCITTEQGVSWESDHAVIHKQLQMTKVSARCALKLLQADEKWIWHNISRDKLSIFVQVPKEFLLQHVTMDETWVYHFKPDIKDPNTLSLQLPSRSNWCSVQARWRSLFYATQRQCCWWRTTKIRVTPLQRRATDLFSQLWKKIKQLCRVKLTIGMLFHQDNAPVHSGNGYHQGMQIWTCPTLSFITWFGILALLTLPQDEKQPLWLPFDNDCDIIAAFCRSKMPTLT